MTQSESGFTPLATATGQPLRLAMQQLHLRGSVLPCGARLSVEHIFQSGETQPLEVIYSFPLPRDAALRQFRITGEGWEVTSDLRPTEEARKAYEAGIRQGALSVMAQQHGDGVINLALGNLRPGERVLVHLDILAGVELRDDGCRLRFPFTLAPTYHRQARGVIASDGVGEMHVPRNGFGDVILPPVHRDASALHRVGFDLKVEGGPVNGGIGSPSHAIRTSADGDGVRVSLATEHDVPNRDLVLDVRYAAAETRVLAGRGIDGKRQFAAVVPSTAFGANPSSPRRVVILLDRSGSMAGSPIAQARRAIEACLGALSQADSFELLAFDDRVESFRGALCAATQENREGARRFLAGVEARGGTELALAIQEAARLAPGGGDVVVLTDGQVSSTESILSIARSTGLRLHCLGIGSASQDRFLTLLARETGGVSRFLTPEERVDLSAVELFASIGRPVACGLKTPQNPEICGLPSAVFSGTPALLFGEFANDGQDTIEIAWDGGGSLKIPTGVDRDELSDTLRLLRGSRLITDCECRYPADGAATSERQRTRIAEMLADLGRVYGLANREMSLVAVVKRASDRPGELPEIRVVPVGMPRGVSFDAYFRLGVAAPGTTCAMAMPAPCGMPMQASKPMGWLARMRGQGESIEDKLLNLAAEIEPDGGMPGKTIESRIAATLAALREFSRNGHTATQGAFRSHVARLIAFLEVCTLTDRQRRQLEQLATR